MFLHIDAFIHVFIHCLSVSTTLRTGPTISHNSPITSSGTPLRATSAGVLNLSKRMPALPLASGSPLEPIVLVKAHTRPCSSFGTAR